MDAFQIPLERQKECSREEALLGSLERSLTSGCCRILKIKIGHFRDTLESSKDLIIQRRYSRILEEAEAAFEIEKIHGTGSLLKLEHPLVINMIDEGRPRSTPSAISAAEIECARRYGISGEAAGGFSLATSATAKASSIADSADAM
jgi:hypothetical protein